MYFMSSLLGGLILTTIVLLMIRSVWKDHKNLKRMRLKIAANEALACRTYDQSMLPELRTLRQKLLREKDVTCHMLANRLNAHFHNNL